MLNMHFTDRRLGCCFDCFVIFTCLFIGPFHHVVSSHDRPTNVHNSHHISSCTWQWDTEAVDWFNDVLTPPRCHVSRLDCFLCSSNLTTRLYPVLPGTGTRYQVGTGTSTRVPVTGTSTRYSSTSATIPVYRVDLLYLAWYRYQYEVPKSKTLL